MGAIAIRDGLYWVGAQDHALRVFDIVMRTEHGTSYNAYLLKTPKYRVLFETVKEKFFDTFLANLREVCDPAELDYIVIDHTEPDHAGALEKLLNLAPKAKVLASSIALGFLADICNRKIPGEAVGDNQVLELDTCKLRFLSVPFLHWPDSIYTYIDGMKTLVTCDSFGAHYADDRVCNDLIDGDFVSAYHYYFSMIMGPFKPHVRYALDRIASLDLATICPGHGPVLRQNLDYYLDLYRQWSAEPEPVKHAKPQVTIAYVSAYGYTEKLAEEIAAGIRESSDADIHCFDMVTADAAKVQTMMNEADGILVGSPTINADVLPPIINLLMNMNGIAHCDKVAGAFGSYGWSGEAADLLIARLKMLRMKVVEPAYKVVFKPGSRKLEGARRYGQRFGQELQEAWSAKYDRKTGKIYWKCTVCGEIFEGALPPKRCSVCGAGQEAFVEYVPERVTFTSDKKVRIAIVGGGIAAVAAAKAARARNANAQIDLYSSEKQLPYHRPILPEALSHQVGERDFLVETEDFYREQRIDIHLNTAVTALKPCCHELTLASGVTATYDKLLLATGGHCFVPPIPGAKLPEVVTLRAVDDLDKLRSLLGRTPKQVVVIGGGLLGLECAWHLSLKDHQVTVLEACPSILPRQLDPEGGAMLSRIIGRFKRIKLDLGVFVDEIQGEQKVTGVRTRNGDFIPCDIVIMSIGVACNKSLAEASGIKVEKGILVNDRMQTSEPDVYAAGDCAIFNQRYDGIWETAMEQGKVAGANMVGDELTYQPKVFGATMRAFNTKLFSVGNITTDPLDGQTPLQAATRNEIRNTYKKLFFRDNVLAGGILIGELGQITPLLTGVARKIKMETAADSQLI